MAHTVDFTDVSTVGRAEGAQRRFKFARQRSKLAGEIRGSFFVINGSYA